MLMLRSGHAGSRVIAASLLHPFSGKCQVESCRTFAFGLRMGMAELPPESSSDRQVRPVIGYERRRASPGLLDEGVLEPSVSKVGVLRHNYLEARNVLSRKPV